MAQHLAELGNIVLLADHLGVGESSKAPDQKKATRQICAQAMHAAVTQFHDRLTDGRLLPGRPPVPVFTKIGGGHSMGAMQTVIQQAAHRSYDAIMFLGYTTQGVHFYHGTTRVRAGDYMPPEPYDDYSANARADQRYNFYWDDVPQDVILFDDSQTVPTPTCIGLDSIRIDIIKPDAAQLDVPVFFGNGERDVSPDPRAESQFFPLCKDFTMYLLPRSAHCQTFAGTRHLFWNRMHDWAQTVASMRTPC
jgi:pimeloyl-ACP methyl ester carboxylesterase